MSLLLIPEIILYLYGFYFLISSESLNFEDLPILIFAILLRILIVTKLRQTRYIYNSLIGGGYLLTAVIAFLFHNFGLKLSLLLSPILIAIYFFLQFQKDFRISNYIVKGLIFSFFCVILVCLLTQSANPVPFLSPFIVSIHTEFFHPVLLFTVLVLFFVILINLPANITLIFHFLADTIVLLLTGMIVTDTSVLTQNRFSAIVQIRIIIISTILTVHALTLSPFAIIIPITVSYLFFIYSMRTGGTLYNENRISLL